MAKNRIIEINPVSRIEGHGKVTLHLNDDGSIADARFHVTGFRGFEKFCEGRMLWEMPVITSRICGICPVSHILASVKAGDAILGVEIPRPAKLLRQLMHMGQIVESHAMHFFHTASPDLLLGMDTDPGKRNIFGLIAEKPETAKMGIRVRSFGQRVIEKTGGGRRVHPIGPIPGGMTASLSIKDRDELLKEVDGIIADSRSALNILKNYYTEAGKEVASFANFPTAYLGLVDEKGNLEFYDGKLRLIDSKGNVLEKKVDPKDYLSIIQEKVEDWSYLKFPFYKKMGYPSGTYRTGPLARLNIATGINTPLANDEFRSFKKLGENSVVQGSMYYHYARLIENLHAVEKIRYLLEDEDICSKEIRVTSSSFSEEGVGVIEAPRGTLFHHYWVDKTGQIRKVNLIVATGHNNLAINQAVKEVAERYIAGNKLTEGMLNRVEAAIRCYDPCLSCSAHSLGQMPLILELVSPAGEVIDKIKR
jgi:NAD-reducing hydrogenase large subunit